MNAPHAPPRMVEVTGVRTETPTVKTFTLELELDAAPGQFGMFWIPGVGEKPLSFSRLQDALEVTVRSVGPFTKAMHALTEGDMLGFRGPLGRGFSLAGSRICVVAGGVGAAPLAPLLAAHPAEHVSVIVGAKTEDELVFRRRFAERAELLITTDDGSCGRQCFASDVLAELIKAERFDRVLCCGPEPLMKKVADSALSAHVPCELSLERYMKCGLGICAQCMVAGLRVCKDGPVFTAEELRDTEFGRMSRDGSGARTRIPGAADDG